MSERTPAEEHLRVIRSLMERATIYRAISAPTALVGGLLALAATGGICFFDRSHANGNSLHGGRAFAFIWLVVLALVLAANALFVRREAHKEGRPFFSSGARLALRAIAPCLVIPSVTTIWFFRDANPIDREVLVIIWIAFYGLALLSTALFAPRSLALLGWAFLLSSLLLALCPRSIGADPQGQLPNLAMGATFGLYHLVYALFTWPRRAAAGPEILTVE